MAITLTLTASNATPNQEDLPEVITIEASAVDSSDPSAVFAYSWHFLGTPPNTAAALANNRAAITTFTADIWGSYRLFCIAQNTSTGETSIVDPLAAPSSSFLDIEVLSENYDLVKPAKTQREWQERYWHLVDTVEGLTFNGDNATTTIKGVVELANAYELATAAGASDSTTGADFCITPEVLSVVLGSDRANGNLPSGTHNNIRDAVKNAALEKMNEVSITEMADVDTTTTAPTAGQALIWSPTHTDDSGDGDTGAWIPGSVASSNDLFGVGLCSGETLDDGDFLIYESDCTGGGPVIIPGWHARNRTYPTFMAKLPFASPGKSSAWHTVAEAAGRDWDDNTAHPGIVSIADQYDIARGNDYDVNVYNGTALSSALANGLLPSMAMTPGVFINTGLLGNSAESILYTLSASDSLGNTDVFYDQYYHTTSEIATLQAAVSAGTYDTLRANALMSSNTGFILSRLGRTSIDRLGDVDTTTTAPSLNDVLQWDGTNWVPGTISSGSASVGDARDIQLSDGSGGFVAANWQISTGDDLIPVATNAYDIGTATNRVRKIYAYDGQFYDDVRVDGDLTVVGQQIMQDYAFINDDGAAGTLLFTAGDNSAGVSGSIRHNTNNVIIESTSSGSEASLEFKAGAGAIATQKLLSNSGKLSNNNSIKLPAMASAPSVGDFLRTTVVSGRDVEVEFDAVKERVVYSTHVSREVTEEASFSGGNMVFTGNQQACMYWFQNNTGNTLDLKATHIHVGEMKNLTLSFSLCKATSASNAISNTWTQVGNIFTITNSSGTDNVIGQAQASVFTTTSLAAGEYLGIACTNIPVLNRDDRRIVITFECEKSLS